MFGGLRLDEEQFVLRGGARIEVVARQEICRCVDGEGRLLYDFRTRKFIPEGRCKIMLLCTIVNQVQFKRKLEESKMLHYLP